MLGSKSKRGIAVMRIHTRQTKVCVNTLKRQRSFLVRNNLADPAKNVQINVNMMMIGTAFLTRLLQLFLFIASFSTIERFPCSVMCCSTRNIILHDIDKNNTAQMAVWVALFFCQLLPSSLLFLFIPSSIMQGIHKAIVRRLK